MTIQNITLDKLVPSKSNVRKVKPSRIEGLAESIHIHGLLQNLQVKAIDGDKFEVVAGGRRLEALKLLAKTKRIDADFPVPCRIIEGDNVHEISLAENELREAMHPADQFEAFKKLADGGMGEETIAARFGVTPTVVKQRLKLAVVSPKLIAIYRKGEMTLEQLMAFTLTDDHKKQEKVWKELPDWARDRGDDDHIRGMLTEALIDASNNKLAKFVGLEAYEQAGGVIVRDLFDERDTGYISDLALLQKLADEKLQTTVEELKAEGWGWVEVMLDANYQAMSKYGRIYAEPYPEVTARLAEIDALIEENEGDEEECDRLQEEAEKLSDSAEFSAKDKARAGVILSLDWNGSLNIQKGYLTPEEAKAERKTGKAAKSGAEGEEDKSSLSAALIETLTAHRTAALQAKMAANPKVALVAAVHALIASTSYDMLCYPVVKVRGTVANLPEGFDKTVAGKEFHKRQAEVSKGVPKDGKKLWDWLTKQDQKKLLELLAVCVASTITVVEKKNGERVDADHAKQLCDALKLDMADYWQPTAAEYFERVSKPAALETIKEACGTDGTVEVAHLKKGELAKRAEKLVAGKRWLPVLLR